MPTYQGGLDVLTHSMGTLPEITGLEGWITRNPATQLTPLPARENKHEVPGDAMTRAIIEAMGWDYDAMITVASKDPEGVTLNFEVMHDDEGAGRDEVMLTADHPAVQYEVDEPRVMLTSHRDIVEIRREEIKIILSGNSMWNAFRSDCGLVDASIQIHDLPETVIDALEKRAEEENIMISEIVEFSDTKVADLMAQTRIHAIDREGISSVGQNVISLLFWKQ